jgi:hypothetical protein
MGIINKVQLLLIAGSTIPPGGCIFSSQAGPWPNGIEQHQQFAAKISD